MTEVIRSVAVIAKTNNIQAEDAARRITKLLYDRQVKVFCVCPLQLENGISTSTEELKGINLDLIFAIGGDGTTLRAFRTIPSKVPLFSINSGGHRGILSEIDADSIDEAIKAILAGKYCYDCRVRIQASINGKLFPPVLNDILILRVNLTRTPLLSIEMM